MTETRARSLAKALSYRIVSSLVTGTVLFGLTQKGWLSVGVALLDSIVKTSIFYLHERTWMMIGFEGATANLTKVQRRRSQASGAGLESL